MSRSLVPFTLNIKGEPVYIFLAAACPSYVKTSLFITEVYYEKTEYAKFIYFENDTWIAELVFLE